MFPPKSECVCNFILDLEMSEFRKERRYMIKKKKKKKIKVFLRENLNFDTREVMRKTKHIQLFILYLFYGVLYQILFVVFCFCFFN